MNGLLLNENLPPSLCALLRTNGLAARHDEELGLRGHPDTKIWAHAVREQLAVMTKDSDYVDLALARREGKVVLIAAGNLRLRDLFPYIAARTELIHGFPNRTSASSSSEASQFSPRNTATRD